MTRGGRPRSEILSVGAGASGPVTLDNPSPLFASTEFVWLVVLAAFALAALAVAGCWRTFEKAGEPGWAAVVPGYNLWVMVRVGHCARWWFPLAFVPLLNAFALARVSVGVADQFGRGVPFGLGLLAVPWLFWPVLGFFGFEYRAGFDPGDGRGAGPDAA